MCIPEYLEECEVEHETSTLEAIEKGDNLIDEVDGNDVFHELNT